MEIFRGDTTTTAGIDFPESVKASVTVIDVFVLENGRAIAEIGTVINTPNKYSVDLPWQLVRQDRDLTVEFRITYTDAGVSTVIRDQVFVQVVTPLLSLEEVARIAGFDLTTTEGREDTLNLERTVRYAIQHHTGQNFGKFYGTMSVSGNGSNKLSLPAPLLEFGGVLYDGILRPNHGVAIINNGWAITGGQVWIDNIKQAPPEWMLDRFDYQGKIYAPMLYGRNLFVDGVEYNVTGMWGYRDVPGDIRQAARLLIQDYSCDESLWRDRYIDSIRAGDWRFEFNAQAFSGTGNVQVDQILSDYRRATMVVI
jgi:hypothetical protein